MEELLKQFMYDRANIVEAMAFDLDNYQKVEPEKLQRLANYQIGIEALLALIVVPDQE